ncbi:MAG: hypothetical protein WA738_03270 [Candidatus Angelobacter sp.]
MKTPQGWTNYSGGTYSVHVPMTSETSGPSESQGQAAREMQESSTTADEEGTKAASAARRW